MNRAQPIAQSMQDFMDNEDGLLGEILITKEVSELTPFLHPFSFRILILLEGTFITRKINLLVMSPVEV
jgi:hypothetical protein